MGVGTSAEVPLTTLTDLSRARWKGRAQDTFRATRGSESAFRHDPGLVRSASRSGKPVCRGRNHKQEARSSVPPTRAPRSRRACRRAARNSRRRAAAWSAERACRRRIRRTRRTGRRQCGPSRGSRDPPRPGGWRAPGARGRTARTRAARGTGRASRRRSVGSGCRPCHAKAGAPDCRPPAETALGASAYG
jgi:hypothetical protein